MKYRQVVIFLCLSLFLSGCGYRFGPGNLASKYSTISVPYAEDDWDGSLTTAVINEIATQGIFEFRRDGGALILKIKILDYRDENVGFRYDRKKTGERKHTIIPVETRVTITTEVMVVDACTLQSVLGPVVLSADVVFDHEFYSSRNGINIFSLGQLTDFDEAYDAAMRPLNQAMAQKIVDYVNDSW